MRFNTLTNFIITPRIFLGVLLFQPVTKLIPVYTNSIVACNEETDDFIYKR
jgi:hypothetical protein